MLRRQSLPRMLLGSALLAGALCRIFVVFTDDGIYWPDEIYQSLEPAHRAVFGYGFTLWEFRHGARNWAVPGVVASIMALCQALNVDTPAIYLPAIRLVFVAMFLGAALAVFRLVRQLGASPMAAAIGAAVWALVAPGIYFSHRALSENAATAAAAWAIALLLTPGAAIRLLWLGGSLLGLSVLFRLQMAVLAAGVLVVCAAGRRWNALGHVASALAVWAVLYGALDALTWGHLSFTRYGGWFHSAITYLRFNLVEGGSAQWGVSPAFYYAESVFASMPIVASCLAVGLVTSPSSARPLTFLVLLFAGAHSMVGHKEYRFILPAIPLAIAAAVVAFDTWPRTARIVVFSVLSIGVVASAMTFRSLSWADVGVRTDTTPGGAWDYSGPVNRLMLRAHDLPDLCGLRVDTHPAFHGGSTYLHRRIRIYAEVPDTPRYFNYAITRDATGMQVVAGDGPMMLAKFTDRPGCEDDGNFDWGDPKPE